MNEVHISNARAASFTCVWPNDSVSSVCVCPNRVRSFLSRRCEQVREYMKNRRLPKELQAKILHYYANYLRYDAAVTTAHSRVEWQGRVLECPEADLFFASG